MAETKSQRATSSTGRRAVGLLLWAGVAVVGALAGFYVSIRLSRPSAPRALETLDLSRPEDGQPSVSVEPEGVEPERAAGLADALGQRTSQRPTTVGSLIEEAQRVLNHLVEAFPSFADAHEVAARLHFQMGDSEKAVEAWERCLALIESPG